jgi:hypothetical protein
MKRSTELKAPTPRRVLARVLAEDLSIVHGAGDGLNKDVKSTSCGTNCDEIVTDCAKLWDDG